MRRILPAAALVVAIGVLAPIALGAAAKGSRKPRRDPPASVAVFATGLNNPRGLTFGPDGNLYVAEGGLGGTTSTTPAQCMQVPPPIGPYTGSTDDTARGGRISRITANGTVTPVITGAPSDMTASASGGAVSGIADVKFLRGTLYGLLSGGGCSHGNPTVPNQVFRIANGTVSTVADLSAFLASHPVKRRESADFEPDGTWYNMAVSGGQVYAVEPNHGEVDRIAPDGTVTRVVDVSASQGHVVPTAIVRHRGVWYLGNLGTFEPTDRAGDQRIWTLSRSGRLRVFASRLEKVVALAFRGRTLYALELSTSAGNPTPATGQLVRIRRGRPVVVASGLTFPTGMTVGPDGAFYVSERGFGFPAGQGRILRIVP